MCGVFWGGVVWGRCVGCVGGSGSGTNIVMRLRRGGGMCVRLTVDVLGADVAGVCPGPFALVHDVGVHGDGVVPEGAF